MKTLLRTGRSKPSFLSNYYYLFYLFTPVGVRVTRS